MAFPIHFRARRTRDVGEADAQLVQQLLVVWMRHGAEAVDGRVDQAVHRAVRSEFVEAHVEPCAVRCVVADVLRELDAPAQARQVVFHALVVAG